MVDIDKQVLYWKNSALEDWDVARQLLGGGKTRYSVDEAIIKRVHRYLNSLKEKGLDVEFGVIFGSYAQAKADQLSDIDVVVVSPFFDGHRRRRDIDLLWHVAARTDNRIEPVPCGARQWQDDDTSAIVEIARREGQKVLL